MSRRKRRAARKQESIVVWIITGLIVLVMLALTNWTAFLCCALVLIAFTVLFFTVRIGNNAKAHAPGVVQGEIVRDRRYISKEMKHRVWVRDGGRCVQCNSRSLLEYDHIIPISKGGATSYENLQILCRSCNRHKSNQI